VRSAAAQSIGSTDSLARRLQQAARAEGGLKHEDGVAAARFRFENLREDSLPISSSEVQRKTRRLRSRISHAAGSARKGAERFRPSCQRFPGHTLCHLPVGKAFWRVFPWIDRIVVAQDQKLAEDPDLFGAGVMRRRSHDASARFVPRCAALIPSSAMTRQQRSLALFPDWGIPSPNRRSVASICGRRASRVATTS